MFHQLTLGSAQHTERATGNGQTKPGGIPLKIEDITKTFNGRAGIVEALHPVDVDFEAGEFVCLLGPSVWGKSTLLCFIVRLNTPPTLPVFPISRQTRVPPTNPSFLFQH